MAIFNSCMLVDSSIHLYGAVLVVADSPAENQSLGILVSRSHMFSLLYNMHKQYLYICTYDIVYCKIEYTILK